MTPHLPPGPAAPRGLVVFLAALTSCTPFGPPLSLPEQGPSGWSELTTEHFVLSTDLSSDLAQQRIERFEKLRSVLEDVAFRPSSEEPPGKVAVIVFRHDRDYKALAPFGTAGVFVANESTDSETEPMILASAELASVTDSRDTMPPVFDQCPSRASMNPNCWSSPRSEYVTQEETEQRLVHEMVHALMHRYFGDLPRWLDEGLAQYFSTLRLEEGRVVLGDPVAQAAAVPASLLPSVRELTLADAGRFKPHDVDSVTAARFYAGAWVLVHLFENGPEGYRERFRVLTSALKDGEAEDAAWHAAMAGLKDETVQADYIAHAKTSTGRRVETQAAVRPASGTALRAMSATEVRSLWAEARHRLEETSP
jgi:hypothetical protein